MRVASDKQNNTMGWGVVNGGGSEIWDAKPTVQADIAGLKDWLRLLFYPKKFLLYRYIAKAIKHNKKVHSLKEPFRILDVGCGTGAAMIDMKRLFGRNVDIVGIDVVKIQTEYAAEKLKEHGIFAEVFWYEGRELPFESNSFNAIYTSDVLGHVEDAPNWTAELSRVLKAGGVLAMFSESKLGSHAFVRKYLYNKGLNTDPHAQHHISLFHKAELRHMLEERGFNIDDMLGGLWLTFLVRPDEMYDVLQAQNNFPTLKLINKHLTLLKRKFHPYTTAVAELYSFFEMITLGQFLETQGYVILAKKPEARKK